MRSMTLTWRHPLKWYVDAENWSSCRRTRRGPSPRLDETEAAARDLTVGSTSVSCTRSVTNATLRPTAIAARSGSSAVIHRIRAGLRATVRRPDRQARPVSHSLNCPRSRLAHGSRRARIVNRDQPACTAPSDSVSGITITSEKSFRGSEAYEAQLFMTTTPRMFPGCSAAQRSPMGPPQSYTTRTRSFSAKRTINAATTPACSCGVNP
jgi:hypothetical protein